MKYLGFFIWGAITMTFWFLSFSTLGGWTVPINGFIAAAIVSTLGIFAFILVQTLEDIS